MNRRYWPIALCLLILGCTPEAPPDDSLATYFDNTGRDDVLAGGVRMIPIETPSGNFKVWTKRIGNNPRIKVLLLHGGPGATHEYLEAFDSFLPGAGIEYYYYDQLGSAYSDQPQIPELWEIPRFVDEVEQVRVALGLNADNFVLYGQSWGGILAIEYALAHQDKLKGLVISNMMASIPAYNEYAKTALMPSMDPAALAEIQALEKAEDYKNPRYMELLVPQHYEKHILRMPADQWPSPVQRAFAALNYDVYLRMQGPSELGASGKILNWDRTADLPSIKVPTLVIGARYDTMDPKHMEWMAKQFPNGSYLYCAEGSHLALYDDQATYFDGLIQFLRKLDAGGQMKQSTTDASDMKRFATRYAAAWGSQDPARVAAFFAESASLTINGGTPNVGRAGITEAARSFMTGYPDMIVELDRIERIGDGYRFHWTFTGTHTGPGGTGRKVRISGYEEWTIGADGLVAKSLGHYDQADWDRQLGKSGN